MADSVRLCPAPRQVEFGGWATVQAGQGEELQEGACHLMQQWGAPGTGRVPAKVGGLGAGFGTWIWDVSESGEGVGESSPGAGSWGRKGSHGDPGPFCDSPWAWHMTGP